MFPQLLPKILYGYLEWRVLLLDWLSKIYYCQWDTIIDGKMILIKSLVQLVQKEYGAKQKKHYNHPRRKLIFMSYMIVAH